MVVNYPTIGLVQPPHYANLYRGFVTYIGLDEQGVHTIVFRVVPGQVVIRWNHGISCHCVFSLFGQHRV
jgi:hypothetical protein